MDPVLMALIALGGAVFVGENIWLVRLWTELQKERKHRARIETEYRDYVMRTHRCMPRDLNGGDQ